MASEFDVYSFIKGQFGVEIVGQGKNGTYDTVHLYIQPFSKNNDKLAVDEYVGRYAETPSWSKIFALSENDLSNAIKIYNNYVVSSDRIDTNMIDKEIYKEMKMRLNDVFEIKESKKSTRKSMKEYRTVGFEQLVRDTIVSVLEDSHSDLFETQDGIITYDNKGRARITSNGDVDMDYITLPTYFWSSGERPNNKKTAKLIDDIIDMNMELARERLWDENKDELIELGITDKDDKNLEYHALYDMGAGDLAEELSEYEMNMEGTDLYTDVYCQFEETDEGIELTVFMTVQDEYGHALVKDYKSNTVLLQEDDDLEEVITDAIREVTKQF